jgi:hypothetical protein
MTTQLRLPGYPLPFVPRDEKRRERQPQRRNPRAR